MNVILASQSPRRKELMGLYHIPFIIRIADIDEQMDPDLPPAQEVARVSRLKAEAVPRNPEDVLWANPGTKPTLTGCSGFSAAGITR